MAVLGTIDVLRPRLSLEAVRQGLATATQVVWLSDGARCFGRLFDPCFASLATDILDFDHASAHLWQAAEAYQDGHPARSPQMWFERLRHQLRHSYEHRIRKEFQGLIRSPHTADDAKAELCSAHPKAAMNPKLREYAAPFGSGDSQ